MTNDTDRTHPNTLFLDLVRLNEGRFKQMPYIYITYWTSYVICFHPHARLR